MERSKLEEYKKSMDMMRRGEETHNAYGFRNKRQKAYKDIQEVKAPTLLYGCMRMLELLGYEWVYSHTDKGIISKEERDESE